MATKRVASADFVPEEEIRVLNLRKRRLVVRPVSPTTAPAMDSPTVTPFPAMDSPQSPNPAPFPAMDSPHSPSPVSLMPFHSPIHIPLDPLNDYSLDISSSDVPLLPPASVNSTEMVPADLSSINHDVPPSVNSTEMVPTDLPSLNNDVSPSVNPTEMVPADLLSFNHNVPHRNSSSSIDDDENYDNFKKLKRSDALKGFGVMAFSYKRSNPFEKIVRYYTYMDERYYIEQRYIPTRRGIDYNKWNKLEDEILRDNNIKVIYVRGIKEINFLSKKMPKIKFERVHYKLFNTFERRYCQKYKRNCATHKAKMLFNFLNNN